MKVAVQEWGKLVPFDWNHPIGSMLERIAELKNKKGMQISY